MAFASGGRRCSEVAKILIEDLVQHPDVSSDDPARTTLPCLAIRLGRTKTAGLEQDERVLLIGRPVMALRTWISLAPFIEGAVFRTIDRIGRIGRSMGRASMRSCRSATRSPASIQVVLRARSALGPTSLKPLVVVCRSRRRRSSRDIGRCSRRPPLTTRLIWNAVDPCVWAWTLAAKMFERRAEGRRREADLVNALPEHTKTRQEFYAMPHAHPSRRA